MLLLTESAVHTRKYLLWRHAVRTEWSEVCAAWRHNKYFPYGPNSRLIRALLYTHTNKTTESQCFPLLLWTEVQPVHTPVRTQAYGPALSQSNFSTLSVFCLVYNNSTYWFLLWERLKIFLQFCFCPGTVENMSLGVVPTNFLRLIQKLHHAVLIPSRWETIFTSVFFLCQYLRDERQFSPVCFSLASHQSLNMKIRFWIWGLFSRHWSIL